MQEQQNVSTIKINNTEIDYAKYVDVVMPMNNLIEYSDNCSKTSEAYGNIAVMNQL